MCSTKVRTPYRGGETWLAWLGLGLFLGAMVLSIAWLVLIETPFNGGTKETVAWLWLPLLLPLVGYVFCFHRHSLQAWGIALAVYPMLLLFAWPNLLAVNASGDTGPVVYEGSMVNQWISRGKSSSYVLVVRDPSLGDVQMQVDKNLYQQASLGAAIRCEFRRGRLGLPYRWRNGRGLTACSLQAD